ncbi:hypothetical protein NADFUDRAFT_84410 [Nadsonia fulvescens var. elongata DSM 6958]|uniref:Cleavage/polyadenylation specificity factor A subunit C-terminal domain-containing protein n=1 Tax=Nadsonia fulvescens var. elongata DSM 6958 TaxID=857566 RepID=A0A1E3PEB4_9ASCO|nr:hypothetical protein NADFUDRAFT_84410 [Nadsonia fulvescens var. elongata DSM 6958]
MSTDLTLRDQSELNLKLEGCKLQFLDKSNDEMVLIDHIGDFYQVKFDADGRKVFDLKVSRLDTSLGGSISIPNPINITVIDEKRIFVGSNTGDAKLLGIKRKGERLSHDEKVEVTNLKDLSTIQENADDYDELDDLYGYETKNSTSSKNNKSLSDDPIMFYVNDTIVNNGPILDMAIGKSRKSSGSQTIDSALEIVASTGSEKSSSLTIFQKSLRPEVVSTLELPKSEKVWSLKLQDSEFFSKETSENLLDEYLITSTSVSSPSGESFIYKIGEEIIEIQKETAFKNDSATIVAANLLNDSVVVQITETELIAYDKNFQRRKTTKSKKNIVSAQLSGSTILTICDDNSLVIYAAETTVHGPKISIVKLPKSITELSRDNVVSSTVSQSTVLSTIRSSTKKNKRKRDEDEVIKTQSENSLEETVVCLFLKNGTLLFFLPADPVVSLVIESADAFPQILSSEAVKMETENSEHQPALIKEVLLTKMGDKVYQNEYLFFAERTGEIHIYELFLENAAPRFVKVSNLLALQKEDNEMDIESTKKIPEVTLTPTPDIDGLSGVFVTGARPYWILKNAQNPIRRFAFGGSYVSHITPFNTQLVYNGFLYCCGDNTAKVCVIPKKINLDSTWPTQKQNFGETIHSLCYHEAANVYVVSTSKIIPFDAVDEDETKIPGYDENMPAAESRKGYIKLLSSKTWDVIDEIELEDNEVALQVKSMKLEVSEQSKRTKEVIVFGTGFYRGEDLATKGEFYIYEIIEVVPEPGKPETNRKFKLIHRERVKGAVTTLCEVAGHLLVAQGPKVVVRNLQEDNSVSPVAFLDMSMYVIEAKSMKNMLMLGDAMNSISFVGFESDPYRMVLFGRDFSPVQTTAAEFIVNDKKLYFAMADVQQKLHVLQYDPDDSTSLSGQRLVRRSECFIGKQVQTMKMLPMPSGVDLFALGGSFDGSLISVIPVSEGCYRRLYVIQQQIIDKEEHNASLNPRMYRYGDTKLSSNAINRALLDYQVIDRFPSLDRTRRQKLSRRLGKKAELDILADLHRLQNIMDYF